VSDPVPGAKLNRRALIAGAIFLVGGGAALARFVRHAGAVGAIDGPVLSAEQFALLEQVSEVIIPATDTPGAIDAGVAPFIGQMLVEWASPDTRAQVLAVLDSIDKRAWDRFGGAFRELPAERRLEVMRAVDDEALSRQDVGYAKFKWLVLAGYYQSEAGATQELRFELVPGAWRSCLPLSEVGRASAV
jgi:glucoside 3-dehydrogenase (cytochrome c) hitch-hiker subunit